MRQRFDRYREFWPHYLAQHRKPLTRRLHALGTLGAAGLVLAGALAGPAWLALLAPALGYGLAWASHVLIERNRPATLRQPFYSLMGDIHMTALMLTGRLEAELTRFRLRP